MTFDLGWPWKVKVKVTYILSGRRGVYYTYICQCCMITVIYMSLKELMQAGGFFPLSQRSFLSELHYIHSYYEILCDQKDIASIYFGLLVQYQLKVSSTWNESLQYLYIHNSMHHCSGVPGLPPKYAATNTDLKQVDLHKYWSFWAMYTLTVVFKKCVFWKYWDLW